MRWLLINPPIREWAKPNVFPLGLGYVAASLLETGHEVEVLDVNALRLSREEVAERLAAAEYDAVGIGGIVTTYRYVKWLVAELKRLYPERPVVVGGSVASSIPDTMMERNPVDVICIGEGERTIVELASALEGGADLAAVAGIRFRAADGSIVATAEREVVRDLDSIPLPAWDLFPVDVYLANPVGAPNTGKWTDGAGTADAPLTMNLYASRGCPYRCTYCYHDFMGHGYRVRSPEGVVAEMEELHARYGVTYFHFIDDEFVARRSFVHAFCDRFRELRERTGVELTWGCTGRVNLVNEELVADMVDAGCVLIGYGIESGSQRMLDLVNKCVTVDQAKEAVRLTQRHLGWADCSFMIGYPGETMESLQETVDFCKELDLAPEVIFFLTAYPGTELYDHARERGLIGDEEEYCLGLGEQGERIRVNFTSMSDEELMRAQEWMIAELKAWNTVKHAESEGGS